jgi:hypothetical protein
MAMRSYEVTYKIQWSLDDRDSTKQLMQSPGYSYPFSYEMLSIKREQLKKIHQNWMLKIAR